MDTNMHARTHAHTHTHNYNQQKMIFEGDDIAFSNSVMINCCAPKVRERAEPKRKGEELVIASRPRSIS